MVTYFKPIVMLWSIAGDNAAHTTQLSAYLTHGRAKQQQERDGHLRTCESFSNMFTNLTIRSGVGTPRHTVRDCVIMAAWLRRRETDDSKSQERFTNNVKRYRKLV
jgi:hypothetical protein